MDAYLKNIKEWGLVRGLARTFKPKDPSVVVGIGDDTAVIRHSRSAFWLLTIDMLVESVHFKKREDLRRVGYKAMAVSLSDIAAMGGEPRYALVSAGLPSRGAYRAAKALFAGLKECADRFGVSVIGGDSNRSERLVIDVAVIGEVEKTKLVRRGGGKDGDYLFVSGALGGSLKGRHLTFVPRVHEARFLVRNFKVHAMIDLSDGLSMDLSRLCEASRLGALVFEEQVPRNPGVRSVDAALGDGEDYELLFALSGRDTERLIAMSGGKGFPRSFTPIGRLTSRFRGVRLVSGDGRTRKLPPCAFSHFESIEKPNALFRPLEAFATVPF